MEDNLGRKNVVVLNSDAIQRPLSYKPTQVEAILEDSFFKFGKRNFHELSFATPSKLDEMYLEIFPNRKSIYPSSKIDTDPTSKKNSADKILDGKEPKMAKVSDRTYSSQERHSSTRKREQEKRPARSNLSQEFDRLGKDKDPKSDKYFQKRASNHISNKELQDSIIKKSDDTIVDTKSRKRIKTDENSSKSPQETKSEDGVSQIQVITKVRKYYNRNEKKNDLNSLPKNIDLPGLNISNPQVPFMQHSNPSIIQFNAKNESRKKKKSSNKNIPVINNTSQVSTPIIARQLPNYEAMPANFMFAPNLSQTMIPMQMPMQMQMPLQMPMVNPMANPMQLDMSNPYSMGNWEQLHLEVRKPSPSKKRQESSRRRSGSRGRHRHNSTERKTSSRKRRSRSFSRERERKRRRDSSAERSRGSRRYSRERKRSLSITKRIKIRSPIKDKDQIIIRQIGVISETGEMQKLDEPIANCENLEELSRFFCFVY